MKILRINDKKCEFSTDGVVFKLITDLGKDDIFLILGIIYREDKVEIDLCSDESIVLNDVEKIIYKNFSEHIFTFIENKNKLKDEIEEEFSAANLKYDK